MDIVGLVLSSIAAAQQLIECGQRIHRRIKDEKKLNSVIREFQMFEIDDRQAQLSVHIQLAQGILKSEVVDIEHKERLERQWKRITERLSALDKLSDEMIRLSSIWDTRARHAARDQLNDLGGSKQLSEMIKEFQDAVMALRELMKDETPLFFSGNDFTPIEPARKCPLPEPGIFLGKGRITNPGGKLPNGTQWFLFESKPYVAWTKDSVKQNVHILARKLHQAQSDRGIYELIGFRDDFDGQKGAFQLMFRGSFAESVPQTLSEYMSKQPEKPTLNFRLSLCYQLAAAVLQTHTLGLVHKNINPENILLQQSSSTDPLNDDGVPQLYLSGWQYARQAEHGVTDLTNQIPIRRKIYQHPERQLPTAEKEYSMAHDVYSLGVCMLEILNWQSLLATEGAPFVSKAFITAFRSLQLKPATTDEGESYTKFPDQIKDTIVELNKTQTPVIAGTKMTNLIEGFITCLDESEDEDESSEADTQLVVRDDNDRRRVAMYFVDTALKTLRNIQCAI